MVSHLRPRPRPRARGLRWSALGLALGAGPGRLHRLLQRDRGALVGQPGTDRPQHHRGHRGRPTPQLGTDLYHQLARQDQNFSFSPYAASIALAEVGAGAAGVTAAQLAAVQHVADPRQLDVGAQHALPADRQPRRRPPERRAPGPRHHPDPGGGVGSARHPRRTATSSTSWPAGSVRGCGWSTSAPTPSAAATTINNWMSDETSDQLDQVVPPKQTTEATRLRHRPPGRPSPRPGTSAST